MDDADITKALIDAAKCARTLIYTLDAEPQHRAWKDNILRMLDKALTAAGEPVIVTGFASECDPSEE